MKKLENHTKILINIPDELVAKIDNFRFENRVDNRNEAIRILLNKGLEAEDKK